MTERFLPEDYEKILHKMYIDCYHWRRSVTEYTNEFLLLSEHNEVNETEGQKVAHYISGLNGSLQEKMLVWTIAEALSRVLTADLMEKSP